MKIMIASDIHGSALYCRQMLDAYEREGADRLMLLGDILYHGPRNDLPEGYAPKEVIAMLNTMKRELLCVRGNCDTGYPPEGAAGQPPLFRKPGAVVRSTGQNRVYLTRS